MYIKKNAHPIVPVYMFHSVADHACKVPYGHLSIPVKNFNTILSYLCKHKFNTITLDDLYKYLSTSEQIPPKSIVITFDDGYLDNWVNVFPMFKNYGMKYTIFVAPEFVDPTPVVRPTLLDVWAGRAKIDELSCWGFLSWNEMKEMQKSGLVDIQSHSLTHTWHFQNSEIIDFHHPGDRYPWLVWNKYQERKYLWPCESQEEFVEFGAPVYSYGRALAAPQYMPDDGLVNALQEYVKKRGGKEFFKSSHWRDELFNTSRDYIKHSYLTERYEDQQEYEERIRRELTLSKEIIERNLCKKVSFLCWPGGAFNQTTQRIAQETGYLATTKGSSRNTWGADPRRINRIGGHVALTKKHPLVDRYANLLMFAATVESYRGNPLYSGLLRLSLRTVHISRWLLGPRGGR